MVGQGILPASPPTDPLVYNFANDYTWKIAEEPVDDGTGQVDMVSYDSSPDYGPSAKFGKELKDLAVANGLTNFYIGVVPCALGASDLDAWARDLSVATLYGSMVNRILYAQANPPPGMVGVIDGILFYQGEADTFDEILAHSWGDRFTTLVSDMRSDLGDPILPIVFAQISNDFRKRATPYFSLVKSRQNAVSIERVGMITTEDLSLNSDNIHLDMASQDIVGTRFANEMWSLVDW